MRCAPIAGAALLALACNTASPVKDPSLQGKSMSESSGQSNAAESAKSATFAEDVAFLSKHAPLKTLTTPTGGKVVVSPKYQARIMTSAVEEGGQSLGYVNRKFIEQGKTGQQFDNYGGEDRFWLGPEGGQYALYFPKGKPFDFASWQTPPAFQEGEWKVSDETASSITFVQPMRLPNYSGAEFALNVERRVALTSEEELGKLLGGALPAGVKWVGFSSTNTITNTGSEPWSESKGLVSVWIAGMFSPMGVTQVIVPFEKSATGPIVNDNYFAKVPSDRLRVDEQHGYAVFKADGQLRSKIGLNAARAKSVIGSYTPEAQLLTIVTYTRPKGATKYVNNSWEIQKEPYGGDVVNSYNDGSPEPGKAALGGFYELETLSPAVALAPGAKLGHVHQTLHFVGPKAALEQIAQRVLGASLEGL